jgi:hypothetical protein
VLRFFGAEPTAAEMDAINSRSRLYSKNTKDEPFVGDAEAKRQSASELVIDSAERWANGPYSLLELKRP